MSKYQPVPSQTEDYIKQLAKDIYNNKVFTAFMIPENQRAAMIKMVFMPLLFMDPQHPHTTDVNTAKLRDNKIWEILDQDDEVEDYNKNFIPSIGMVYEYYVDEYGRDNCMPRGINGFPMFSSCRMLNLEDTEKLREFYEKYSKIREEADNF
jgi:hypothetical protein